MSAGQFRTTVRRSATNPNRWFFGFDLASPGGSGGASLQIDPFPGFVSIDGVHKNENLPPRSTGRLLAASLSRTSVPQPTILEVYNVEDRTAEDLDLGGTGENTLLGYLLENTVRALGGSILHYEPIRDGTVWHLRVHISYP